MRHIIHKDGRYNIYSTISDAPIFESGLSFAQIHGYLHNDVTRYWSDKNLKNLAFAKRKGTSEFNHVFSETIASNRAGPKESNLSYDEFVERFLS